MTRMKTLRQFLSESKRPTEPYVVHDYGQDARVKEHRVEARDREHAVKIVKDKLKGEGRKYPSLRAKTVRDHEAHVAASRRHGEQRAVSQQVSVAMRSKGDQEYLDSVHARVDSDRKDSSYRGD